MTSFRHPTVFFHANKNRVNIANILRMVFNLVMMCDDVLNNGAQVCTAMSLVVSTLRQIYTLFLPYVSQQDPLEQDAAENAGEHCRCGICGCPT